MLMFIIVYLNKSWNLSEFGNIAQNGVHEILVYFFIFFVVHVPLYAKGLFLL